MAGMEEDPASVVDRFQRAQREMYAGGDLEPVEELLAEDIVWHVPGKSPIAGDHRGREAVIAYFRRRRELAGGELRIIHHGSVHNADTVVQLADGEAVLGGHPARWRTAGVYRVAGGRIAEAWLVPLELDEFDRLWSAAQE